MIANLAQDVRFGLRMMLKSPGFTFAALITLALGIGANTVIFTAANSILLQSPFRDPSRLVALWESAPRLKLGVDKLPAPSGDFIDWRDQNSVFEFLVAFRSSSFNLTGSGTPERIGGAQVGASFFSILGTHPVNGRGFLPEEEQKGKDKVVIISNSLWKRQFGSDPLLVGKTLQLNGQSYLVIGIMPSHFTFPGRADMPSYLQFPLQSDIWVPMAFEDDDLTNRSNFNLAVIGRLKPGVSMSQADADMAQIASRIDDEYRQSSGFVITLLSLKDQMTGNVRTPLLMLMVAVGFVMLIACLNVANLLLARGAARQKEFAIRTALGATRLQLARQVLIESVVLALIGGILGFLLGSWGVSILLAFSPDNISGLSNISVDGGVFAFTFGLSLFTGMLAGLVSAFQSSKADINTLLKQESRGTVGGFRTRRIRNLLVASEVALALMLLIGAGLLIRSFRLLQQVNPGFNTDNVLTMRIALPDFKYPKDQQRSSFFNELLQRVTALPGVKSVGSVTSLPLSGAATNTSIKIEGRTVETAQEQPLADYAVVSPNYFTTLAIPLIKGRVFTDQETETSVPVVIINQAAASRFWPQEDPIGKRFAAGVQKTIMREVIGIVGNIRGTELSAEPRPEVYVPYTQNTPRGMFLVTRTSFDPLTAVATVRNQVQEIDGDQPVYEVNSMQQVLMDSISQRRFNMLLLAIFAALALVLAVVGIYAVISDSVNQRTREIGIRKALGAKETDIIKLILLEGMEVVVIGVVLGLASAFGLTQLMESLLYQVKAGDKFIFLVATVVLSVVALLSIYIPARRTTKIDPIDALRQE